VTVSVGWRLDAYFSKFSLCVSNFRLHIMYLDCLGREGEVFNLSGRFFDFRVTRFCI
jgi:hypothetical protein